MILRDIVTIVLIFIGTSFMVIAGIGVLRMPDLYIRMSATTKVATMGVGSILLAIAVYFQELGITSRALATVAFLLLTAPVAAHMIARAAYFTGVPLCNLSIADELKGHYDLRTHKLESICFPELELHLPDMQVTKLRIPTRSVVSGKTLAEIDLRRQFNVTLLAVCRGSHVISNPDGDVELFSDDEVILIGFPEDMERAVELFQTTVND